MQTIVKKWVIIYIIGGIDDNININSQWLFSLLFFGYFFEKEAHCFQFAFFLFLFLSLQVDVLFIAILNSGKCTLSWFLVFFGKNALRIWKSVPCFFNRSWKSSNSYSVHLFDFYLVSTEWLLDMESLSLWVKVDLDFPHFLLLRKDRDIPPLPCDWAPRVEGSQPVWTCLRGTSEA